MVKKEIIKLEEELRLAMLTSDVKKLDALIDDSLIFIGPDGSVATKEMDLSAHRSKIQKMTELTPREQVITAFDGFVVVTVIVALKGTFGGIDISGVYRYLRVWKSFGEKFRVVSGSVSKIISQ